MNIRGMGVGVSPPQLSAAPHLLDRRVLVLAAGEARPLNTSGRAISSLIGQAAVGVLDVWFGEVEANTLPDLRFQPGMGPQQVFLPATDYILTVSSPKGCTARLILIGR